MIKVVDKYHKTFLNDRHVNDSLFKHYYINTRKRKRTTIKCGTIILNKDKDQMILVQNNYLLKEQNVELWGIPKGSRIGNETYADCAIRETYEETGIKFPLKNNMIRIKIKNTYYFIYIMEKPTHILITNDKTEIHKVKWFDISEIDFTKVNLETKLFIKRKLNFVKKL
jgi:ADP-ribose pyrophosphatase YjhB (NUDIX family)|tara:strand:+ start:703 stop:1209 length:507 start_codon:yes stop_codon:yes gene_type:complete